MFPEKFALKLIVVTHEEISIRGVEGNVGYSELEERAAYTKEMMTLDDSILPGTTLRQLEWYEKRIRGSA